jgi:hypothetical protein
MRFSLLLVTQLATEFLTLQFLWLRGGNSDSSPTFPCEVGKAVDNELLA